MTDQANGKADAQTPPADDESFREQLSMMRKAFMTSPVRNSIFRFAACIAGGGAGDRARAGNPQPLEPAVL